MPSVLDVAVQRSGLIKGARALAICLEWARAEREAGHPLGGQEAGPSAAVREYAELTKQAERTAWRDMKRFRETFWEFETPAVISAAILEHQQGAELDDASIAAVPLAVRVSTP